MGNEIRKMGSEMIEMTKELVNDMPLRIFDSWVANGHWAVRKDMMSNGVLFTDKGIAEEYLDVDVIMGAEETIREILSLLEGDVIFRKQPWLRQDGYGVLWRLFQSQSDENIYALFNEIYVTGFGIVVLRGVSSGDDIFRYPLGGEPWLVVMPYRLGKEPIRLPGLSELL